MSHPICAVATPVGRSAIGVIRVSGDHCLDLLSKVFKTSTQKDCDLNAHPRMAVLGRLFNEDRVIDEVIILPFKAPQSYTGEDSAEIYSHGNPVILKAILTTLYSNGFQKASAGEFTKRAFLSNKVDLTQAQAVREIIEARTEIGVQKALQLKEGSFRNKLLKFRSLFLNIMADFSAELDFIEEDIQFLSSAEKNVQIDDLLTELKCLERQSDAIKIFREGLEIVISGPPNVGKSSLLNHLAGQKRAIVSGQPGTTRDYLETEVEIEGIPVSFVDTAGIRSLEGSSEAEIERMGIESSLKKVRNADLVLFLLDGSLPIKDSLDFKNQFKFPDTEKMIVLVNKKDILHPDWEIERKNKRNFFSLKEKPILISALTGENTDSLQGKIKESVFQKSGSQQGIMMSSWQKDMFSKLISDIEHTKELLRLKESQEIIVASLQNALDIISQLIGEISDEDILGRIFSRFCIGK